MGTMGRMRHRAALILVSAVAISGCVAASVAASQVASAAKGAGPIADLVIDRLAALAVLNFFALGTVAVTMWNASAKRVKAIAAAVIAEKTSELGAHVTRVEGLVQELSVHLQDSAEQRRESTKLMERILAHMSEVEKRHYAEDVIRERRSTPR